MKYAFHGLISILETNKVRTSALKEMSVETSQTTIGRLKKKRTNKQTKHRKEYPRTVGQIQKVYNMCNCNSRKRREREESKRNI